MSIDAMKQALAALNDYEPNEAHKVATALRAAIEQAQAPVAWRITDGEGDYEYCTDLPEDWSIQWSARYGRKYEPLYTAPRQWQGLTDEEADELIRRFARYELLRAIEAKLKERNT